MNESPLGQPPASSGPAPALASCPGCGQGVDPLRAGHVAILGDRFHYFCRPSCKQEYLRAQGRPLEEDVATSRPPEVATSQARPSGIAVDATSVYFTCNLDGTVRKVAKQ